MTIDQMLAAPGFYDLTSPLMHAIGHYVRIEVDDAGVCYQLTKTGQRDGVLSRDGWGPHVIVLGRAKPDDADPSTTRTSQ